MNAPASQLERFVARVRVRLGLWRVLESAAVGLMAGCTGGALAMGVMLLRHEPAWNMGLLLAGAGAAAGIARAVARWPRLFTAAISADRALGTRELISTAWTICQELKGTAPPASLRDQPLRSQSLRDPALRDPSLRAEPAYSAGPFQAATLALAQDECQRHAARAIGVRRLGARAWGGLGISAAAVLTLGFISTFPAPTRANAFDASGQDSLLAQRAATDLQNGNLREGLANVHVREGSSDTGAGSADDGHSKGQDPPDVAHANDPDAARHDTHSSSDGTGAGTGASGQDGAQKDPKLNAKGGTPRDPANADPDGANGRDASGDAPSRNGDTRTGSPSGNGDVTPQNHLPPPPWRTTGWTDASKAALWAADHGQLSAQDRDIVRAYFRRGE